MRRRTAARDQVNERKKTRQMLHESDSNVSRVHTALEKKIRFESLLTSRIFGTTLISVPSLKRILHRYTDGLKITNTNSNSFFFNISMNPNVSLCAYSVL